LKDGTSNQSNGTFRKVAKVTIETPASRRRVMGRRG